MLKLIPLESHRCSGLYAMPTSRLQRVWLDLCSGENEVLPMEVVKRRKKGRYASRFGSSRENGQKLEIQASAPYL